MKYSLNDAQVRTFGDSYFIAPNASVIGNVTLGKDASIWFGSTLRGDNEPITIDDGTSVQDNCVLHTDPGCPIYLGKNSSVGHMVMLHGCTIGEETLIGIGSIVLNGAKIGNRCLIGANTLITEGKEIPDGSVVMGSPGKIIRKATERDLQMASSPALHYATHYKFYLKKLAKQE